MIMLNKKILYTIRKEFKNIFPLKIKSSYLTESLAYGYGFKSAISLLTYIELNPLDINKFSKKSFVEKLKSFYKIDDDDFYNLCEESILMSIKRNIDIINSKKIPLLDNLDLDKDLTKSLFSTKNGIVIASGITGAGKTTLISSILQEMFTKNNTRKKLSVYQYIDEYKYNDDEVDVEYTEFDVFYDNLEEKISKDKIRKKQVFFIGEMRTQEAFITSCELSKDNLIYSTMNSSSLLETIHMCFKLLNDINISTSYFENINILICQELINSNGPQKIPLREYLVFNDELKSLVLKEYSKNKLYTDVINLLKNIMIGKHKIKGLIYKTKIMSAIELYEKNKISKNDLDNIIDKHKKDYMIC